MIPQAVAQLHDAWPLLSVDGLQAADGSGTPTERDALVAEALRFPGDVEYCLWWLSECAVVKAVNQEHDTYRFKHEVEKSAGRWVSHFALLIAAQAFGLPIEANPSRPWAALLPLGKRRPGGLP